MSKINIINTALRYIWKLRVNLGSSHHKIYIVLFCISIVMTQAYLWSLWCICRHYAAPFKLIHAEWQLCLNKLEEKTRIMFYLYRTVWICSLVYISIIFFTIFRKYRLSCLLNLVNNCISLLCKFIFRVWASSGSWWWTGRPGMPQSMESQNRTPLSNWTELSESLCWGKMF